MARLARVVIAGHPHHVSQRRQQWCSHLLSDSDYALYLDLLGEHGRVAGVAVWAWCLVPNHVHLRLPSDEDGLRRALAPAHRRYAGHHSPAPPPYRPFLPGAVRAQWSWTGNLFWPRSPMCRSIRCARPVDHAGDWRWSRTRAHLSGRDDGIAALAPVRARIPDHAAFLAGAEDGEAFARLRGAESIGRPLGDEQFIARLERLTKRRLRPGKRGPKPKERQRDNA